MGLIGPDLAGISGLTGLLSQGGIVPLFGGLSDLSNGKNEPWLAATAVSSWADTQVARFLYASRPKKRCIWA